MGDLVVQKEFRVNIFDDTAYSSIESRGLWSSGRISLTFQSFEQYNALGPDNVTM